jgi:predicted translin family RNA/ssDNA-binding protein
MALTKQDLLQIKGVVKETVDESISQPPPAMINAIREALKPDFAELRTTVLQVTREMINEATDDICTVMRDGFTEVGVKFQKVDKRLDRIEKDVKILKTDMKAVKRLADVHSVEIMELKAHPAAG